jgi:signal transduction histidine kinase/ActR/RegA family two-component response regulator/HAMP domain-containing protein
MRRLSLARSFQIALLGLTLTLAVIAALGIAALYDARQHYEDRLADTYELQAAGARLLAAGVVAEAARRATDTPTARAQLRQAEAVLAAAGDEARRLARGDPASARLVRSALAGGDVRSLAPALDARQRARRAAARDHAGADTRRAFLTIAVAGGLAVLAALALATLLIGVLRRPLDQLVHATRRVAGGDLEPRLDPDGPRELRELGESFNAMATDLDSAGRALEAERERLAVTVESLGDALVSCDADGVITAMNPRAEELVGTLQPGVRADDPASPLPALEDALAAEVIVEHEGRTLAVTAVPLGLETGAGTVWTVRDVSERARLDRLKSEFVATASHELRSPLTSIKGFAELLARSGGLDDREHEFAEMILLSADRMVELANDLLDVASVEAGQVQLRRRPLDLGEAVEEVASLMRPRFAESGQRLEIHAAAGVPRALADAGRVRQIITNLLTNAHLYTGEGGRVVVEVEAEDRFVSLAVSDTGRGMTAEDSEQVFERFYRGGDGGGPSGTGLGLSIVRSLVDLHGGTIEVESAPGRGTTFRVRLPRALEPEPGSDAADAIRGKRVLVVDDEPAIADLIVAQLAPFEVDAVTVHSGEAAMERLRVETFDAVTLDILMPGMSGFEVLRAIRSDPVLRHLPVVIVSVFTGGQALHSEWAVSKPIDADELTYALGSAVLAGRVRVLVVGRAGARPRLEPELERLGIPFEWVTNATAAARECETHRFEAAMVDAGLSNAPQVLGAIDLRGRRLGRSVVVFATGDAVPGLAKLDPEPVPFDEAAREILGALEHGGDEYA